MGKNWTLSVYQGMPQAMKFSVYLIDLLSILLSCNDFTRIQKAVVDQKGSRPSNSDHGLFFSVSLALGNTLEPLLGPTTDLIDPSCPIKSTLCCILQSDLEIILCWEE